MNAPRAFRSVAIASFGALALVAAVGCSAPAASAPAPSSAGAAANEQSTTTEQSNTTSDSTTNSTNATSDAKTSQTTSTSNTSTPSTPSAPQQPASSANDASKLTPEDAIAQGYQVFEGTVRVCSGEELIQLQSLDIDPAALGSSVNGTYAVLVFDAPTDVTGESADGTGQRTDSCKMVGIAEHTDHKTFVTEYGDLETCKGLDGQRVVVAAKAENIMHPTDVRFPVGEPSVRNFVFIS